MEEVIQVNGLSSSSNAGATSARILLSVTVSLLIWYSSQNEIGMAFDCSLDRYQTLSHGRPDPAKQYSPNPQGEHSGSHILVTHPSRFHHFDSSRNPRERFWILPD